MQKTPLEIIDELTTVSKDGGYLGFIVKRPIDHAPISNAVITCAIENDQVSIHPLVRADYKIHFGGAELTVSGFPFTQQDSRVGACAQAAIWSACRHFHRKHRANWYSIVDITKEATKVAERSGAMQLPSGADFLDLNEMLRAIRATGRKPLIFAFDNKGIAKPNPKIVAADATSIINRYVDSGIPVIVGLTGINGNTDVGHAITVSGHTLTTLKPNTRPKSNSSKSIFCKHFIANDDQRGINLKIGVNNSIKDSDVSEYYIMNNIAYLIVPLPDKVYMTAEHAEVVAWGALEEYINLSVKNPGQEPAEIKKLFEKKDIVASTHKSKKILARTYLTYGWKYKLRSASNKMSSRLQETILNKSLPKFIWITEFSLFIDQNTEKLNERRIIAHVVCDATSSVKMAPKLISHFPGLITIWPYKKNEPVLQHLDFETEKYYPKLRGILNFPK